MERKVETMQGLNLRTWFEEWNPIEDGRELPPVPGPRVIWVVPDLLNPEAPSWLLTEVLTTVRSHPEHVFCLWSNSPEWLQIAALSMAQQSRQDGSAYQPASNLWLGLRITTRAGLRRAGELMPHIPAVLRFLWVSGWEDDNACFNYGRTPEQVMRAERAGDSSWVDWLIMAKNLGIAPSLGFGKAASVLGVPVLRGMPPSRMTTEELAEVLPVGYELPQVDETIEEEEGDGLDLL